MWFGRVYEKEGLGVLREEIHSQEVKTLEQFVGMFDGAMTSTQVMQLVAMVATNLNSTQKTLADLIRRIGVLADREEELSEAVRRLMDVRRQPKHKANFRNALGQKVE